MIVCALIFSVLSRLVGLGQWNLKMSVGYDGVIRGVFVEIVGRGNEKCAGCENGCACRGLVRKEGYLCIRMDVILRNRLM